VNNTTYNPVNTFISHNFSDKNMLLAVITKEHDNKELKSIDYRTLSIGQKISYWWNDSFNLEKVSDYVSVLQAGDMRENNKYIEQRNIFSRKVDHHNAKHSKKITIGNITSSINITYYYEDENEKFVRPVKTIIYDRLTTKNEIAAQINNIQLTFNVKFREKEVPINFYPSEIFNKVIQADAMILFRSEVQDPNEKFIEYDKEKKMKDMNFSVSLLEFNKKAYGEIIFQTGFHKGRKAGRVAGLQEAGKTVF